MSWPKGKSRTKHKAYLSHKRWRAGNLAAGLTLDGKQRRKGRYYRYNDLRHLPAVERRRIIFRRWLKRERYDKGLTYRGTERWTKPLPPLEQAWNEFKRQFLTEANEVNQ